MGTLAEFLRDELAKRGWTQLDLEQKSGISNSALSRIMNGKVKEPRASVIKRIADAIGVPFWRLMLISGLIDDVPLSPSEQAEVIAAAIEASPSLREMFQNLNHLTPEDRDAVQKWIRFLAAEKQIRSRQSAS